MRQLYSCFQDTLLSAAEINVSTISELNLVISCAYVFAKCFCVCLHPVPKNSSDFTFYYETLT